MSSPPNQHRACREKTILDVTRHLLLEHGYRRLNMDRIAACTDYSKGTIYQHFTCKEDVLAGVVEQSLQDRYRLFERASMFLGRTREKIVAVGIGDELFHRLHPEYQRAQQVIRVGSLLAKISRKRRRALRQTQERILEIVNRIIHEALDSGDLQLRPSQAVADVTFALWALVYGIRTVGSMPLELKLIGVSRPEEASRKAGEIMLDGLGWKPLASDWDYATTRDRICLGIFPDQRELLQDADEEDTTVLNSEMGARH